MTFGNFGCEHRVTKVSAASGREGVFARLPFFKIEDHDLALLLRLESCDGTNRLTRACVLALNDAFNDFACAPRPVIITGNEKFFSAGADLNEIGALTAAFSGAASGR